MLVDSENSVVKLSPVVDSMVVKGLVEKVVSWDGISDIILVLSVLSSVLVSGFVNTTEVVESIPDVEAEIRNEKRIFDKCMYFIHFEKKYFKF